MSIFQKKQDTENANKEIEQFEDEIKRQLVSVYNVTAEVNQRIFYDELSADNSRIRLDLY